MDTCFPDLHAKLSNGIIMFTCMVLALKTHHYVDIPVGDLIKRTKAPYDLSAVINAEADILQILGWSLHPPVVSVFIDQMAYFLCLPVTKIESAHAEWQKLCHGHECIFFKSSVIAAVVLQRTGIDITALVGTCFCGDEDISKCFAAIQVRAPTLCKCKSVIARKQTNTFKRRCQIPPRSE